MSFRLAYVVRAAVRGPVQACPETLLEDRIQPTLSARGRERQDQD